jgi:Flp pilus assembly protein TadG
MILTKQTRRGALLTLELIIVLPILLGLLFGIVEFGLVLEGAQRVQLASQAGAQVAQLPGVVPFASVDAAVNAVLAKPVLVSFHTTTVTGGANPGDPVTVQVKVLSGDTAPDLLALIGFTLADRYLIGETTLLKQ